MAVTFSIILPTWNNPQFLTPCIDSIRGTGILEGLGELIIVNNGKQPIKEYVKGWSNTTVLEPGENLGWEGGLALGLKHSKAPYVCFQNDDTHIPSSNHDFYQQLLYPMSNPEIAAVGPSTTVASGWHSIFMKHQLRQRTEVSFLIFFTVMVRRSDLDSVGGIDTTAPGGDDFDLSIRLRKAGKKLIINPRAFIIHHGFKTGERVRGNHLTAGGWNSQDMTDRTNQWLIQKHGFKSFFSAKAGLDYSCSQELPRDSEGDTVRSFCIGESVVELGCGYRKTVPQAIGIDRIEKGQPIPHVPGGVSQADIVSDVTGDIPLPEASQDVVIARHILEHCIDTIGTISNWSKCLKTGGRMIIAVPNQDLCNSIPLNPEHVHAFTPDSLSKIMQLCGFKSIDNIDPKNGVSFVGCYEKTGVLANA